MDSETPLAPVAPSSSGDVLATLSSADRETWLKTGELPVPPSHESADAENAETPETSEPVDAATEIQTAESVETEKATETKKVGKPRDDIRARLGQLAEQRKAAETRAEAAERELQELKQGRQAPQPNTPAPSKEAIDLRAKIYVTPQGHPIDFSSDDPDQILPQFIAAGYQDAYAAMNYYTPKAILQFEKQAAEQARVVEGVKSKVQSVLKAGEAKYDDWVESLKSLPVVFSGETQQLLIESDLSVDVIYHLSKHPAEARALAAMDLTAAAKRVGHLEARLSGQPSPAATKLTSEAPPPAQTLGRKPAVPKDDLAEAEQSGDVSRYIELANKRELAESGRR